MTGRHYRSLACLLVALLLVCSSCRPVFGNDSDFEDDEDEPFFKNARDRKLVTTSPTYRSIVKENERHGTDVKQRNFAGPTLGYITPWNGQGYEIAKKFHCKFDLLSPAWFQVKYQSGKLILGGEHDVDQKWVRAVRDLEVTQSCPHRVKRDASATTITNTKIIPRFLIDGFDLTAYEDLFAADGQLAMKFADLLVKTVRQYDFDGLVLDAGYLNFRTPWREQMIKTMILVSKRLHEHNLIFTLVIPPLRSAEKQQASFNADDFTELHEHIDYFSLMTYDFSSSQNPGPSSPLPWFRAAVASLLTEQTAKHSIVHKILGGVNLYGNDFHQAGGGSILGDGVVKLLKSKKPKIVWDDAFKEHRFEYSVGSNTHTVWFPTLAFIDERIKIAETQLFCGLSFWEIGQGMDYFYDLL